MRLRRDLLDGAKELLRPGMSIGDRLFGLFGLCWALAMLLTIPVAIGFMVLSFIRAHIDAAVVWSVPAIAAWFIARATLFD